MSCYRSFFVYSIHSHFCCFSSKISLWSSNCGYRVFKLLLFGVSVYKYFVYHLSGAVGNLRNHLHRSFFEMRKVASRCMRRYSADGIERIVPNRGDRIGPFCWWVICNRAFSGRVFWAGKSNKKSERLLFYPF